MGRFRLRGRRRRARQHRPDRVPLRAIVPNLITSVAACAGITSIVLSSQGHFMKALVALLIACICDGVDGRVARMLKASSKLGAELDSLADFVNFGVAPAMFMFFWLTGKYCGGTPVVTEPWMVRLVLGSALFYAMCDCFRLARFNTMLEQPSLPYWKNFFTGVPAPGGCWMVLTPAVLSMSLGGGEVARSAAFLQSPVFGIFMLLFVGALMASRIPTISLKSIRISRRYLMPVMAVLLLVVALLVTNFWMTIGTLGALYILTVPLSALAFVKVKLRYEAKEALTSDRDKGKI